MGQKTAGFECELLGLLAEAERRGEVDLMLSAGDLHKRVGGYPAQNGSNHAMPTSSDVLRKAVLATNGREIAKPKKGRGSTYTVSLSVLGWIQNERSIRSKASKMIRRNPK